MSRPLDRLLAIMARLRDPERGCPWDREQDFATIAPYTIEEAYEVADAIERGDMAGLKDELGDLLFQVVFHARMAEEAGLFAFDDVAAAIADKMVRRHPHVFGDGAGRLGRGADRGLGRCTRPSERRARAAAAGDPRERARRCGVGAPCPVARRQDPAAARRGSASTGRSGARRAR